MANTAPDVTNVTAAQRTDGSRLVDIGYDLADADGDPCTVWVEASDDGGAAWDVPAVTVNGDVGGGITPGTGKAIVWDCGADLPGEYGTNYMLRVCADDGQGANPGMVLVPAGEFEMGDHHDGWSWALPVHAVYLDSFYMDIYEVTNQQYADALNWAYGQGSIDNPASHGGVVQDSTTGTAYCDTTGSSSYSRITWGGGTFGVTAGKENHPMVEVSWYGAAAYANWRSGMDGRDPSYNLSTWDCDFGADGYRLPTEAEWEYAARGGEHDPYYRYPWGNGVDGSMANDWSSGDPFETGPYPWTTPVGYYDGGQTPSGSDMANGYGLYDVSGNVWEWCHDWYGDYSHCDPAPCNNPHGPTNGTWRVLRGGSWVDGASYLRCANRDYNYPYSRYYDLGFRLALDSD